MESGTPGVKSTSDGFLSRAVSEKKVAKPSPLRALAVSPSLPRILPGSAGAVSMTSVADFGIRAGASSGAASDSFESMYSEAVAGTLQRTARDSFDAVKILKSADPSKITPENGAEYPKGPFGNSLKALR
ncbi:MAG: hypothetical protein LC796_11200 [Acidobacteria bacterium]|nr:hypothetical protein [Acidobacteriota bacterium]MCA1617389.1 hypothetical protein [Acidobacteriota bacterium]